MKGAEQFLRGIRLATVSIAASLTVGALAVSQPAQADGPGIGLALKVGSTGVGLDLGIGINQQLGVRLGYAGFQYTGEADTSDVNYDGKLKLGMGEALVDWFPFSGGFRLSAGVIASATKLDVVGKPSNGTYTVNGQTFTSSQIGSVTGSVKFGNSVAPYLGLGWGNPANDGHWHFMLDLGAIYGGTPNVSIAAHCGPAAPQGSPTCNEIQTDVATEKAKFQSDVTILRWYPVANIGVAYHF